MDNRKFEKLISSLVKKKNINKPSAAAFFNFHDLGSRWCEDWTTIFNQILDDIKAGNNYKLDEDNKEGNCVAKLLANGVDWLAVYFTPKDGNYNIYMIKLENSDDVMRKNYRSLFHRSHQGIKRGHNGVEYFHLHKK
ncbi:hypothetical protein [Treponema sp. R80B11-R83G3]